MNVTLTEQAIKQCGQWIGVRNQVEFGTQICNALDEFEVHGVGADRLCAQALDWVDDLTETLDVVVSDTAWFGIPDLQLGSQLTDPPNLDYMSAYWSSPTHDFVPFLIEVKNKYDGDDLFQFAQSIPTSMDDDDI